MIPGAEELIVPEEVLRVQLKDFSRNSSDVTVIVWMHAVAAIGGIIRTTRINGCCAWGNRATTRVRGHRPFIQQRRSKDKT
jgi:hypothetical protein